MTPNKSKSFRYEIFNSPGFFLTALLLSSLLITTNTHAYEQGDILVRGRIINVNPDDSSSVVSAGIPLSPVANSGVSVDDDTTIELDFTYMLSRNWGLELIVGSSEHDVPATGVISGNGDIINARTLPPTLTLQYHFRPDGDFQPYVGAGINYTHFFDEKVTGGIDAPGAKVRMDSSWGVAAQIGADYKLNEDWFLNVDIKYIKMETTAHFKNTTLTSAEVDVEIDPFVFGIGIGKKF